MFFLLFFGKRQTTIKIARDVALKTFLSSHAGSVDADDSYNLA